MAKMQPLRVPRTLPLVLSREEVARLIAAAPSLKSQTALSVAYGASLRASEVFALKVGDVDSKCMTLRVEHGKRLKHRYAMHSPVLLERLRAWWRVGPQGKILPRCLDKRYCTPSALRRVPRALGSNIASLLLPISRSQACTTACVCLVSGVTRSFRPFQARADARLSPG